MRIQRIMDGTNHRMEITICLQSAPSVELNQNLDASEFDGGKTLIRYFQCKKRIVSCRLQVLACPQFGASIA